MAVGDSKWVYSSPTTLTASIGSLASDTNLLAGYQTNVIDNSSTGYSQIFIGGKTMTGTTPTAGRVIQVWVIGTIDGGTTWPDVFGSTAGAKTVTSANVLRKFGRLVELSLDSTSNQAYFVDGQAISDGVPPVKSILFITQSSGANLHATAGNHAFYWWGAYPNTTLS